MPSQKEKENTDGKATRRNHSPEFKAKVAMEKELHAKIGELTLENDFLEGALAKAGLLSAKR